MIVEECILRNIKKYKGIKYTHIWRWLWKDEYWETWRSMRHEINIFIRLRMKGEGWEI